MAGLFGPKIPSPIPVVNPADTANRVNQALSRQLQSGGTNADNVTNGGAGGGAAAAVGGARLPTLTGLS
jgi:hypothetical protein